MAASFDPNARIAALERELQWAHLKIQVLTEEPRQQRVKFLGPRSETLSNLQLELLADEEPVVSAAEVEAEAQREPVTKMPPRERKPHPGRKPLPKNLPRVEEVIACALRHCKQCGADTAVIGYDESERLDCEPARYFVRVTKREKRACRCCQNATVTMPELAPRNVEKGLASDRLVIQTVIDKYCNHLPLYRQAVMLEREAGVEISRATLDGWLMRVGELLLPVIAAMRQNLLRATYLQADETIVPVQMHDNAAPIIRLTYGSTASRVERRCSTFAWVEGGRVRRYSWESGKAFCRLTDMQPTTWSAGRSWCMWAVGLMPGGSS